MGINWNRCFLPFYKFTIKPNELRSLVFHFKERIFKELIKVFCMVFYKKPVLGNLTPTTFKVSSVSLANFSTTFQLSFIILTTGEGIFSSHVKSLKLSLLFKARL